METSIKQGIQAVHALLGLIDSFHSSSKFIANIKETARTFATILMHHSKVVLQTHLLTTQQMKSILSSHKICTEHIQTITGILRANVNTMLTRLPFSARLQLMFGKRGEVKSHMAELTRQMSIFEIMLDNVRANTPKRLVSTVTSPSTGPSKSSGQRYTLEDEVTAPEKSYSSEEAETLSKFDFGTSSAQNRGSSEGQMTTNFSF